MALEQDSDGITKSENIINKADNMSIEDYFYDMLLPQAIMFGMTVDEFWYGVPRLLWSYYQSYKTKMEIKAQIDNQNAWLSGFYVYDAVSVVMAKSFSKNGSNKSYISKPIDLKLNSDSNGNELIKGKEARENIIRARFMEVDNQLKNKKEMRSNGDI